MSSAQDEKTENNPGQAQKLIFLPWYHIKQKVVVGDYELHPIWINKTNPDIAAIERNARIILHDYLRRPFTDTEAANGGFEDPVKEATIVIDKKGNIDQEHEILQYLISISGICNRRFHSQMDYLGSENLKIFIQKFTGTLQAPFSPFVTSPRKDGQSGMSYTSGYFREVRAKHITDQSSHGFGVQFDEKLANCLWHFYKAKKGKNKKRWENRIFPSIFSYYHANTDGSSHQTECIYSHTAIERLLLGTDFKEHKLINELNNLIKSSGLVFAPLKSSNRDWSSLTYQHDFGFWIFRRKRTKKPKNIMEAWLRELTRVRNAFAHGNPATDKTLIWSIDEHLQLSSLIFPILLRMYLSNWDKNPNCKIDQKHVDQFRYFPRALSLNRGSFADANASDPGHTNWSKIWDEANWGTLEENEEPLLHDFEYN